MAATKLPAPTAARAVRVRAGTRQRRISPWPACRDDRRMLAAGPVAGTALGSSPEALPTRGRVSSRPAHARRSPRSSPIRTSPRRPPRPAARPSRPGSRSPPRRRRRWSSVVRIVARLPERRRAAPRLVAIQRRLSLSAAIAPGRMSGEAYRALATPAPVAAEAALVLAIEGRATPAGRALRGNGHRRATRPYRCQNGSSSISLRSTAAC